MIKNAPTFFKVLIRLSSSIFKYTSISSFSLSHFNFECKDFVVLLRINFPKLGSSTVTLAFCSHSFNVFSNKAFLTSFSKISISKKVFSPKSFTFKWYILNLLILFKESLYDTSHSILADVSNSSLV